MSDQRLPKKVFYGEIDVGKRSQGGQNIRYYRHHKSLPEGFEYTPVLETKCRGSDKIRKEIDEYEAKKICEAERKGKERKIQNHGIIIILRSVLQETLAYSATRENTNTYKLKHRIIETKPDSQGANPLKLPARKGFCIDAVREPLREMNYFCIFVLWITSGPRVKFVDSCRGYSTIL